MIEDEDDIAASGFGVRLSEALGRETQNVIAKRSRVSTSVMSKYLQGAEPGLFKAARIAKALKVSLWWLATGEGKASAAASGFEGVPIYDVRLAAGAASFAEGAQVIGEMPLDAGLLRSLGRANAEGLGVFEAEGDSMFPLISDGSRVITDLRDTRLREGVFAFRFDDELRIKRLRRTADGIEVISQNPLYEPELLQGEDLERFALIGRALMAFTPL